MNFIEKLADKLGIEWNKDKRKQIPKQKPDKKVIAFTCLKTLLILFLTVGFIGFGVLAGAAIGYITTSDPVTDKQLRLDSDDRTILYDKDGKEIISLSNTDNKNQQLLQSLDEVPKHFAQAVVAIEDKRFFDHNGVDLIRTSGAILSLFFGGGDFGGSTITQQLVKNATGDMSNAIPRKIREIWRALQLDNRLSKDEILTHYLNFMYMGYDIYGIKAASKAYLQKDVSQLNLAECAFLAGITNNPSLYNPLNTKGRENAFGRQGTILNQMREQGFIDQAQLEDARSPAARQAIEQALNSEYPTTMSQNNVKSYFVEQVILDVRSDLMNTLNISKEQANQIIYGSGAKIYTTYDPKVQAAIDKIYQDESNFPYNAKNSTLDSEFKVQSATVIIDPNTGYVRGLYGGSGIKEVSFGLNRATRINRQPGSTLKPIMIYGPLIDAGAITMASIFDDTPRTLDSSNATKIYPTNFNGKFQGVMTISRALTESNNVIPTLLFTSKAAGMDYQQICLTALAKVGIVIDKKDVVPAVALGGLKHGTNPLTMAAAYAPYANGGFYYTPTCYTKVVDNKGNTLLNKELEREDPICGEEIPYIMTDAMKKVVTEGTAKGKISIKDNQGGTVEAAGKTGSTNEYRDSWFVGYTPSYVGATWYGFDDNSILDSENRSQSTVLWGKIMAEIHKEQAPVSFDIGTAISRKICTVSGMLANEACEHLGHASVVQFTENSAIPTAECTSHVAVSICSSSNQVAKAGCPSTHKKYYYVKRPLEYYKPGRLTNPPIPEDIKSGTEKIPPQCTIHGGATKPTDPENSEQPQGPSSTPDASTPSPTPPGSSETPDATIDIPSTPAPPDREENPADEE